MDVENNSSPSTSSLPGTKWYSQVHISGAYLYTVIVDIKHFFKDKPVPVPVPVQNKCGQYVATYRFKSFGSKIVQNKSGAPFLVFSFRQKMENDHLRVERVKYKILKFQKLVGVNATYIKFDKTTSVVILMCLNVCVNYSTFMDNSIISTERGHLIINLAPNVFRGPGLLRQRRQHVSNPLHDRRRGQHHGIVAAPAARRGTDQHRLKHVSNGGQTRS